MRQMSRLRLGADCEGLALVAEGDLILTSATAPTVFRCFWLHRFSGDLAGTRSQRVRPKMAT
jgi:hypothetical protein